MSNRHKENEEQSNLGPGLLLLVRLLMAGAIGVSGYLAWTSLSGGAVAGCGPDSGCDKVLHSRWAYWLGIPVSLPALLVYFVVLGLSFRLGAKRPAAEQRKVWPILAGAAFLLIGGAIWFTGLQWFAIHSFCKFCMTGHALGILAAAIILSKAPIRPAPEKQWQQEKQIYLPVKAARTVLLFALGGVALLAAGQVLHQQKLFAVQSVPESVMKPAQTVAPTSTVAAANVITSPPPRTVMKAAIPPMAPLKTNVVDHRFQIYRELFQFDLREVPLIGSTEAPCAMLSLFDYTCHHCRLMHQWLVAAQRTLSNQLAIVSLPMPLDSTCNYTVKKTPSAHTNACQYAQLGLQVWRANKEKQPIFDDYIFTGEKPPALAEAQAYARNLVGNEAFEKAGRDPWIAQQLTRSVSVYATNYLHVKNGSMPQLKIETNLTTGSLDSLYDLYQLLNKQLGIRAAK